MQQPTKRPMPHMDKPFSPACEENKAPILAVLASLFADRRHVLEIGSGTGQHAVHFARAMPHLTWQCSDIPAHLPGIGRWLAEAQLENLPPAITLDVDDAWPHPRPAAPFDAAYSANTTHIMSWPQVERLFAGVGALLPAGAPFALYGPFSTGGQHNSRSNADFDRMLRLRDPDSGVRDLDELTRAAAVAGFVLEADTAMPVNNRTLIWRKHAQAPAKPSA
jgi:cyclopropane fatty-acyl-phospholipid synthase-like methyltransferase